LNGSAQNYLVVAQSAVAASATGGKPLDGPTLELLSQEEVKLAAIVRRMKEICGTTGQHLDGVVTSARSAAAYASLLL
jgi:hypothetical protein